MKGDKKLVFVSADNNNKFYNMHDNNDETFTVEWGRIGATKDSTIYPIKKWDSIYRDKTRKGYKDVTEIFAEATNDGKIIPFANIKDSQVNKIIEQLQRYAKKSVQENYTVASESVTQKQIDEAQAFIDQLAKIKPTVSEPINELLLEIYSVIPRRMNNVKYHLFGGEKGLGLAQDSLDRIISNEQSTLDVMRGQVSTFAKTNVKDNSKKTLLEAMGISIEQINDNDHATITKLLGLNARQFKSAFRLVNNVTQERYDKFYNNKNDKRAYLFWHGSRNENWWNILDTGLLLRPANVVLSGKMFGYGIYFADKAQKSIGYSSLRGSYWASGSSDRAYLALFQVHTGSWLHVKKHEYWMADLNEKKLQQRGAYDSLFAEGGYDLRNNEYIVYNQNQCTIKYLVEIGA